MPELIPDEEAKKPEPVAWTCYKCDEVVEFDPREMPANWARVTVVTGDADAADRTARVECCPKDECRAATIGELAQLAVP